MLGVIVCPRCTQVQGADLSSARVTCPRCGHRIEVRKAKVYFSTDSPKELAEGVRQVGERLVYDIERPGAPSPPMVERRTVRDRQALRSLIVRAIGERGEASREDLKQALGEVEEEELGRVINLLLEAGIMYEVGSGRYRAA
ncbi:MAG: hypothetical protein SA339_12865 [Methanomassiliicoccus sp.]|nr:hypothetical protein [Methanomassiliicoccus sp.]